MSVFSLTRQPGELHKILLPRGALSRIDVYSDNSHKTNTREELARTTHLISSPGLPPARRL